MSKPIPTLALALLLTGCSVYGGSIKQDGAAYGGYGATCVHMPEWANTVKEDLGHKKVCLLAGAQIVVVPQDVAFTQR